MWVHVKVTASHGRVWFHGVIQPVREKSVAMFVSHACCMDEYGSHCDSEGSPRHDDWTVRKVQLKGIYTDSKYCMVVGQSRWQWRIAQTWRLDSQKGSAQRHLYWLQILHGGGAVTVTVKDRPDMTTGQSERFSSKAFILTPNTAWWWGSHGDSEGSPRHDDWTVRKVQLKGIYTDSKYCMVVGQSRWQWRIAQTWRLDSQKGSAQRHLYWLQILHGGGAVTVTVKDRPDMTTGQSERFSSKAFILTPNTAWWWGELLPPPLWPSCPITPPPSCQMCALSVPLCVPVSWFLSLPTFFLSSSRSRLK